MANELSEVDDSKTINKPDAFSRIRRRRLMQICGATAIGLVATLFVARGFTFSIFAAGLACLLLAMGLAQRHIIMPAAFVLLGSMATMLFVLALTGAGLFDIAMLGYPALFVFAAILGGLGLFLTVLFLIIGLCLLLGWMTLQGIITPNVPYLSWPHLIFIMVIFNVTGFSVFVLVQDIKRLLRSLQNENAKVQQSRAKIQHLAHHDPLTNLPNRLYGELLFKQSLADCAKREERLALLFVDLDNFKPVNDALGHAAGDDLLQQLSKRLNETLAEDQYLIRFGGDEFLVLAPLQGDEHQLDKVAEALIHQCASVFKVLQTQVVVSASIGIACAPDHGDDFKQLCRKADIAMYQAKQDGRNTYHYYTDSLDKESEDKFRLLQRLRPALNQQEFELYYQPMVNLTDNTVDTLEALIRWPQKDGSIINPDEFIPLAESSGLITDMGSWVIQQACLFCAELRQNGHSEMRVSVNISVVQFKDEQLQSVVEQALSNAQLPPEALELELTESLLIDQTENIQSQLNALINLGITIAIDDFGTGYSNLGYLRKFNAAKLKIDRTFVSTMCQAQHDESLVRAIINMASSLELKTVAEGIEDEATLQKLRELGCDIGQGYFWAKPLPDKALAQWLEQRSFY